jgi:hypothetical protein
MVADFVKGGMRKESKEEARGPRGRAGMVDDPAVSLMGEVDLWVMRVSLEGKSRAVVGMVEWFVIGNVVLETDDVALLLISFFGRSGSLLKLVVLKLGVDVEAEFDR